MEDCSFWGRGRHRSDWSAKLLSMRYSNKITSRVGPRSRKTFASLGALVLCAFVFAFAGEKAQAQQLPPAQQHTVIEGQVVETVAKPPVEAAPVEETFPWETAPAKTAPVESTPPPTTKLASGPPVGQPARPVPEPAPAGSPVEPTLPDPELVSGPVLQSGSISGSVNVPAGQHVPEAPVDPDLESPASGPSISGAVTGPAPAEDDTEAQPGLASGLAPASPVDQELAPGPVDPDPSSLALEPASERVDTEESKPLSLLAEEAPAAEPAVPGSGEEEDSYPLSVLETSAVSAVEILEETLESAAANALGALVGGALSRPAAEEGEGLINTALASLFSGGEAGQTSVSEPVQEPESSSTGTGSESPLKDAAPQPVSPFTPPAGSSSSLSGVQIGASGVVLLLLCVLASGLILPRRDFKLLWAFCELPKPSSALRLPLERPG